MIPQSRFGAVFETTPGRVIAILELFRTPLSIGQVACGKDRPGDLLDQLGCRLRSFWILATSDVACTDENKSSIRQPLFWCLDVFGLIGRRPRWCLRQDRCWSAEN